MKLLDLCPKNGWAMRKCLTENRINENYETWKIIELDRNYELNILLILSSALAAALRTGGRWRVSSGTNTEIFSGLSSAAWISRGHNMLMARIKWPFAVRIFTDLVMSSLPMRSSVITPSFHAIFLDDCTVVDSTALREIYALKK